jgi:hypothetical protein
MPVFYFENLRYPTVVQFTGLGTGFFFGHQRGVAYEREGYFFATGLNRGGQAVADRNNGISVADWIAKAFGDTSPVESDNEPGVRFKRIARPLTLGVANVDPAMHEKLNESFVALRLLLGKLQELFETIEPTMSNAGTHGHKIRNVLLLACMEVESSWSAVLKENGYTNNRDVFTTNDYVKLFQPMLLDGYEVHLQSYSSYPAFTPFAAWSQTNPTQSLAWYNAYNKTKHDREGNLDHATLEKAIHAVGAAVVMFYVQFGMFFGTGDPKNPVINNIFRLTTVRLEKHERSFYIPLFKMRDNQIAIEPWTTIDFPF